MFADEIAQQANSPFRGSYNNIYKRQLLIIKEVMPMI